MLIPRRFAAVDLLELRGRKLDLIEGRVQNWLRDRDSTSDPLRLTDRCRTFKSAGLNSQRAPVCREISPFATGVAVRRGLGPTTEAPIATVSKPAFQMSTRVRTRVRHQAGFRNLKTAPEALDEADGSENLASYGTASEVSSEDAGRSVHTIHEPVSRFVTNQEKKS
jgi:hypothetical protein